MKLFIITETNLKDRSFWLRYVARCTLPSGKKLKSFSHISEEHAARNIARRVFGPNYSFDLACCGAYEAELKPAPTS